MRLPAGRQGLRSVECGVIRAEALGYVTQPFRAEFRS
jgi:hypothetical protein